MKRAFDLLLVVVSAPLWLTLMGLIAIFVRTKLGRPVFFRQVRPGLHGECFELLKFRSMTEERHVEGHYLPDSQRLTRFGAWLRATSLDELPELFNVLRGQMSLVGPRPLLPEYLGRYTPEQARRHEVKPGITGWAQVNGRNGISWEEKFKLDVWYVQSHCIALDIRILWLTVWRVIKRDGINQRDMVGATKFQGSIAEDTSI